MNVTHVSSVGDPPGSVGSGSVTSYTCNCACNTCMSGSCCRFNVTAPGVLVTTTTSGPVLPTECNPTDHAFAKLNPSKLFCRKCGVTRKVR